ncbi:hypothetical protein V6098_27450, partial [Klebsiella pneumoniae]
MAYRIDQTELGMTYVKEIDDPLGTGKQKAISFSAKYSMPSFWGVAKGQSTVKLQYGKGVIAPYLNTSRITVLREGANKQVISSQADSLIKISRIWAD